MITFPTILGIIWLLYFLFSLLSLPIFVFIISLKRKVKIFIAISILLGSYFFAFIFLKFLVGGIWVLFSVLGSVVEIGF